MRLYWRIAFHGVGLIHHLDVAAQSLNLDFSKISDPMLQDLKTYSPLFLTAWNFAFQVVFLLMAFVHDLLELSYVRTKSPAEGSETSNLEHIRNCLDVVFSALVFPYTVFVAAMFWTLYFVDRELVYPRVYDEVLTWFYNLSLHAWIIAVPVLEMLLVRRTRGDRTTELAVVWTVQMGYALVFYSTYFITGRWLYQLFQHLPWIHIIIFQLAICASIHMFYEIRWYFTPHREKDRKIQCKIDGINFKRNCLNEVSKFG